MRASSIQADRSALANSACFDDSGEAIDFVARGDAAFVLGSAVKHPHELFMGH